MSFGSWEPYEMLAAAHLLDENDPNRLTFKELKDGWGEGPDGRGPCYSFMESYCLKPWIQEDLEEALAISKAMKEADQENDSNYEDNEKVTDSLVQDGAEKAHVEMDDTSSPKSEERIKGKPRSSTESNVEDYVRICWSCSKTKMEVKLYKCAGCGLWEGKIL